MFKTLLTASLFLTLFGFSSFAQLDSTDVTLYSENYTYLNDENESILAPCIKVETWVNDFDFFGEILVIAFDNETNYPVQMVKFSKEQLLSENLMVSGIITTRIYNSLEIGRVYRVDVQVRDYQGMNLELNSKTILINN